MAARQEPVDESFEQFVRARHTSLLRFAHALTGDPHLAADLVQDALERTGLAWPRVVRKDAPDAYVRRAIVNGYTSHFRKRRRERLVDAVPERPVTAVDPPGTTDGIWRVLATLPTRQRAVLVLRYYEDLSEADTARALGVTTGTIKSQTSKGLAALRTALAKEKLWTS